MHRRDFLRGSLTAGFVAVTDAASAQTQLLSLKDFIAIRFCPTRTRVRRNIYTLHNANPNHPVIAAYRAGVAAMKALPANDPRSWTYQANIHGTTLPFNQWPAGAPFATCEHGTAFFLSWHRIYLHFFERIVRSQSGDSTFALPYWNYGATGQAALPPPFRNATVSGSPNPLHDGSRSSAVNGGSALSSGTVSSSNALSKTGFLGSGQFQSTLEGTPHGSVHVAIGGNMGNFAGAGRDPIFWLHHCNIDRLWEAWLAQGGGRANPIGDASWMNETSTFRDENGNAITMVNSDILETRTQLGYRYDDPARCVPLVIADWRLQDIIRRVSLQPRLKLELRRDWKIDLGEKAARFDLFDSPEREKIAPFLTRDGMAAATRDSRILLRFKGLQLEKPMGGYFEVWIQAGDRPRTMVEDLVFVGNLTTFGADAESQRTMMEQPEMRKRMEAGEHVMGVSTDFDVTDILSKLVAESGQAGNLVVELRPVSGVEDQDFRSEGAAIIGEVTLEVLPVEPER